MVLVVVVVWLFWSAPGIGLIMDSFISWFRFRLKEAFHRGYALLTEDTGIVGLGKFTVLLESSTQEQYMVMSVHNLMLGNPWAE